MSIFKKKSGDAAAASGKSDLDAKAAALASEGKTPLTSYSTDDVDPKEVFDKTEGK